MTAAEAFRDIVVRWRSETDGQPQLDRLGELTIRAIEEAEARGRKAGLESVYRELLDRCAYFLKVRNNDLRRAESDYFNGVDDAAKIVDRLIRSIPK